MEYGHRARCGEKQSASGRFCSFQGISWWRNPLSLLLQVSAGPCASVAGRICHARNRRSPSDLAVFGPTSPRNPGHLDLETIDRYSFFDRAFLVFRLLLEFDEIASAPFLRGRFHLVLHFRSPCVGHWGPRSAEDGQLRFRLNPGWRSNVANASWRQGSLLHAGR